jgi:hypothetical protein
MKCGTQPANISMIHRRQNTPRVAFPFRCDINAQTVQPTTKARIRECYFSRLLTPTGHINVRSDPLLEVIPNRLHGIPAGQIGDVHTRVQDVYQSHGE